MAQQVTLGGDRLGSGKKNKIELHNYFRSTHDLSQSWTSPMTVGALFPFLVIPAMRNDKFEIELNADCITIPTKGPLFGSFKFQLDVFACPIRLYQAILHNNPTNIGLKMNQVMLPTYELDFTQRIPAINYGQMNNSSLWKYLGLSGLGRPTGSNGVLKAKRAINAVPLLAYYDIFKNYYSNKQEEYAYTIGSEVETTEYTTSEILYNGLDVADQKVTDLGNGDIFSITWMNVANANNNVPEDIMLNSTTFTLKDENNTTLALISLNDLIKDCANGTIRNLIANIEGNIIKLYVQGTISFEDEIVDGIIINEITEYDEKLLNYKLLPFKLKNIDDMRMSVLSHHTLGTPFKVSDQDYLPYNINNHANSHLNPLNGLVVKTYQSDLFNNWINTEWIDGENGIAEITKIATSEGAFKIDQLNLAEKLYNMLNRVAVSGGTYEDWQDAVYDQAPHKHIESPIYCGGMSSEIVFEQIVSSAASGDEPLGELAGRGRHVKRKGGHINIKCDEACFIIGIASITPRLNYCQGNEFYLTELQSLDDMHKPALDGIGFQNLLGERLAWWDTQVDEDGNIISRSTIGKLPAWIEYMTAVDKTFGDFANTDVDENGDPIGKAFMVLNRNYSKDQETGGIKDATTYIDPTKYNYAFAYTTLDAMNFWAQIRSNIKARRKMSAKQIPNI